MNNFIKKDLGKATFSYIITIPKTEVNKYIESVFQQMWSDLEVEGFRKGKMPQAVAQKNISKSETYSKAISALMPDVYRKLINDEKLQPIVNPRIELIKARPEEDLEVEIKVAVKPTFDLGDYKKELISIKKSSQKDDQINTILDTLLKKINVDISELIIEVELERRLAKLVDDVTKIGLTMEAYLSSKGETQKTLREKLTREIVDIYKLEFILEEIANVEKISADENDLEKLFISIKDESERAEARKNSYFYTSLARRQKTLDFLLAL